MCALCAPLKKKKSKKTIEEALPFLDMRKGSRSYVIVATLAIVGYGPER